MPRTIRSEISSDQLLLLAKILKQPKYQNVINLTKLGLGILYNKNNQRNKKKFMTRPTDSIK